MKVSGQEGYWLRWFKAASGWWVGRGLEWMDGWMEKLDTRERCIG